MRKYIIYCLVSVLLISLVPVGKVNAAGPEVYEITIYPNRMLLFNFDNDDLVLGDVKVSYDVDYESNNVNIYFDESIFVSDIISSGNTIHKSVSFNDSELLEVNKELDTNGFVSDNVQKISLSYGEVSNVSSITIQSANIDFSGGLLDGKPISIEYVKKYKYPVAYMDYRDTLRLTDNNFDTSEKFIFWLSSVGTNYSFNYVFNEPVDIKYYRIMCSIFGGNFLLKFYDENGVILLEKSIRSGSLNGELVEIDVSNCKKIVGSFSGSLDNRVRCTIYDFNLYSDKPKIPDVIGLEHVVNDNNVIFTWTNPTFYNFIGVNIYRNDILIAESYNGTSYTDSELDPGEYTYKITTVDSNGNESKGINISITIEEPPPLPSVVKGIKIINKSSTGGMVTWNLNPESENIKKYIVYINGEKHGETETPSYILKGLEEGKKYDITVAAMNDVGEGPKSSPVFFMPTKILDMRESIKIRDIFSNISMFFRNMWSLLALALAIIISPKIYNLIKTNVT